MRVDHLLLIARAQWRAAFALFLLAVVLSVWLMSASNTPSPMWCGNAPVAVDSTVAQRWAYHDPLRLVPLKARYGADVDVRRGERVFKNHCAACHKPDKDLTGPALKPVIQHAPTPTSVRTFLTAQDSLLRKKDPYTTALNTQWGSSPYRHEHAGLSAAEVNDLMAWLEQFDAHRRW